MWCATRRGNLRSFHDAFMVRQVSMTTWRIVVVGDRMSIPSIMKSEMLAASSCISESSCVVAPLNKIAMVVSHCRLIR